MINVKGEQPIKLFDETKTSNYTNFFIDNIGRSWIKV